jgi:hypothetical protein
MVHYKELISVKSHKKLVSVVGGKKLEEEELEFSKDFIESFFLLLEQEEALVWYFL